jgi:predicted AAA+ superfamily ATPase
MVSIPSVSDNTPEKYRPRVVDTRISELLSIFGGVLIIGPKWCGKSWTGLHHSKSSFEADINTNVAVLDPGLALKGDVPRLIDEWQDAPKLWDVARRIIDDRAKPGQFIFTGSADPRKGSVSHTGTGRFARVRMRPMSLFESGHSDGYVSLSALFNGVSFEPHLSSMDYGKAVQLICTGGWPSALGESYERAINVPREYIDAVVNSDISGTDGKKRDRFIMSLVLRSLARNTATYAKASVIAEDVSRDRSITEQTVRDYIGSLMSIFVLDEQEAWCPRLRSRVRIRSSPKRHFTDPSLAVAAMKATAERIRFDPNTAGFLFESLCYRDLCIYSSAIGGQVYYYGDNTGLEIDSIVELGDGRWGAIEVKLGDSEFDKAANNLLALKKKVSEDSPSPSFLMIICATGGIAYVREDGVMVVPADCLGP